MVQLVAMELTERHQQPVQTAELELRVAHFIWAGLLGTTQAQLVA
jgi:hypothetical protein